MGLILDSSLLIAHERQRFDLFGFLATRNESVAVAAITISELWHGYYRATEDRRQQRRLEYVERIISLFSVIPFALEEARYHARLWSELSRKGKMIGSHDLLIAATALNLDYAVATLNTKEFLRVPGLCLVEEKTLLAFYRK